MYTKNQVAKHANRQAGLDYATPNQANNSPKLPAHLLALLVGAQDAAADAATTAVNWVWVIALVGAGLDVAVAAAAAAAAVDADSRAAVRGISGQLHVLVLDHVLAAV